MRRPLAVAYWLSGILALAALVASAIGVFYPHIFRDPAMTAGNAQGTSLIILVVAIPALVAAMLLTARGSLRGQIIWLGALGYLAYNGVLFAFDTAFNELFLLYVAMLSLSCWSLVTLLVRIDVNRIRAAFLPATPVRAVSGYMLAIAALFAVAWLGQILPAIVTNTTPGVLTGTKMLTSPIHVLDLGFTLPLTALAAVWLWQRKPLGFLASGAVLVMLTIETASIATDQWFGHLSDPSVSPAMAPVFAVFTLIALVPTVALLWNLQPAGDRLLRP